MRAEYEESERRARAKSRNNAIGWRDQPSGRMTGFKTRLGPGRRRGNTTNSGLEIRYSCGKYICPQIKVPKYLGTFIWGQNRMIKISTRLTAYFPSLLIVPAQQGAFQNK